MKYDKIKVGCTVKEQRISQGLTQFKLSELSGISLRSIQRIENGEVDARDYTLNLLKEKLKIELDESHLNTKKNPLILQKGKSLQRNYGKEILVSYAGASIIFVSGSVFVSKSSSFPETNFEAYNFMIASIFLYSMILFYIWRKVPHRE